MKKLFIVSLIVCLFTPLVAFTADISFNSEKRIFSQNEEILVNVFIDTKDETANAVEGVVRFSSEFLEFKGFRDGGSVINFWVEKGQSNSSDEFSFSGITPGGFSGPSNFLFSLVFKTKKSGASSLRFDKLRVLKNDGSGTKIETTSKDFDFIVEEKDASSSEEIVLKDNTAPESFHVTLGQDPDIFDNNYFIVFSAADKGWGIDHYEVREGEKGSFKMGESPYLLEDQSLSKKIFVKAVDKNGNEKIVTLDAQNAKAWYENYFFLAILVILICAFIVKKLWPRFVR